MNEIRFVTALLHSTRLKLHTRCILIWAGKTQAWGHSHKLGMSASISHHILCRSCNRKLKLTEVYSKSYGGHIWSNQNRFLERRFTVGQYTRYIWLPHSLPTPAHVCDAPLPSDALPACVCLFISLACYPFSSVWWSRSPDQSEQEEHAVASQAQSAGPLLLHAEVVTGSSSLTIVPLPETAWHSLVLLPLLQCLNIPVGWSRVLDFVNIF